MFGTFDLLSAQNSTPCVFLNIAYLYGTLMNLSIPMSRDARLLLSSYLQIKEVIFLVMNGLDLKAIR